MAPDDEIPSLVDLYLQSKGQAAIQITDVEDMEPAFVQDEIVEQSILDLRADRWLRIGMAVMLTVLCRAEARPTT